VAYQLAPFAMTLSQSHSVIAICKPLNAIFTARRNARIAIAVLATAIPSVCLSVRHTPVLCQDDGT